MLDITQIFLNKMVENAGELTPLWIGGYPQDEGYLVPLPNSLAVSNQPASGLTTLQQEVFVRDYIINHQELGDGLMGTYSYEPYRNKLSLAAFVHIHSHDDAVAQALQWEVDEIYSLSAHTILDLSPIDLSFPDDL